MKSSRRLPWVLSALGWLGSAALAAAPPPPALPACLGCHGANGEGNAATGAPALAGQAVAYLERQLQNYRSGLRGADADDAAAAQMRAAAAALADAAEVTAVAEHFAALPPTRAAAPAQGDLRNGRNRYQGNCGACHGGKAEGNAALSSPRLAGLEAEYLRKQYALFKDGKRGAQAGDRYGMQMRLMAGSLPTAQDLDDVIAYIHSLGAEP